MNSSSSYPSESPKKLRTLACNVKFPGKNALLHQFVLDNSHPNRLGIANYINAVLLSMSDAPADEVNALNHEGYSALHLAVLKQNLLMVEKLLACLVNVDVDARCRWGYKHTALHLAAELGHLPVIKELLDKGAGVDIKNTCLATALYYAVSSSNVDVIELLVRKGANVNLSCAWDTPLSYAVRSRNLEVVECLVRSGADVNFAVRRTPLWYAAGSGSLAIVEFLVSNGADVNARSKGSETPLHRAARSASLEIVEYLVRKGADIHAKDVGLKTSLHHAVRGRKSENAAFLLDRGAYINARDMRYETPLHCAVKERNSEIDDFLKFSSVWESYAAVSQRNLKIVKLLTEQGADLRSIDEGGRTPLHDAVYGEDFKIAAFLSDQGEGPHADRGWNPGRDAAYRGCAKMIRMLLGRGADVNAKNKDGETPLALARNQLYIDALRNVR